MSAGSYEIRNQATGPCVDVSNNATTNNAPIGQWSCHGGTNQRWRAEIRDDGRFLLRSVHSNKCLEVMNYATGDDAALVQYTCDGLASQVWDLTL